MAIKQKTILWWGKSDIEYSRNRICRQLLQNLGYQIVDFSPLLSRFAAIEAQLRAIEPPSLIWVPCFRQRDIAAASQWAKKHHIPLIVDPLISAWEKQVFERKKFLPASQQALAIKQCESSLMQLADVVLVDTDLQSKLFAESLGVQAHKLFTVYVGAEQSLFQPMTKTIQSSNVEVLFYGSFIGLHGVETIVRAAKLTQHKPNLIWTLLGSGPLKPASIQLAANAPNVRFEDAVPYLQLPQRIAQADLILGVFGGTTKAGNVIPNKVFQALACGKPVITRESFAYPQSIQLSSTGLVLIPAEHPQALADAVLSLSKTKELLEEHGAAASQIYQSHFEYSKIERQLKQALASILNS